MDVQAAVVLSNGLSRASIRAFIRLRELLASHKDLADEIEELEKRQMRQATQIHAILQRLIEAPTKPKHPIGFVGPSNK